MKRSMWVAVLFSLGVLASSAWAETKSTIGQVSYDGDKKALTVVFDKGGTFEYADVPQATYDDLQKAESKGEFFNKNVRGKFKVKKLAD